MPTFRVVSPGTIQDLSDAISAPVVEAVRMPGRGGSTFRAWVKTGECYELTPKRTLVAKTIRSLTGRMAFERPIRRTQFDRVQKMEPAR